MKVGLDRRRWLASAASIAALIGVGCSKPGNAAAPAPNGPVDIEEFDPSGKSLGVKSLPKVVKTEAEWRTQLSPAAFDVTRKEGTERAYSGEYWDNHADGLYRCICCDTALYDSKTKYESGTGWPSFWQPIAERNISQSTDFKLGYPRTAVSCARCDAHLGHVFDDGPQPTGKRHCMNSVALRFVARA